MAIVTEYVEKMIKWLSNRANALVASIVIGTLLTLVAFVYPVAVFYLGVTYLMILAIYYLITGLIK